MRIKIYFITLAVFLAIDFVWLTVIAKNIYADQLGFLMAENINWIAAILFYLLFCAGIVTFVIMPSLEKHSSKRCIQLGLLFGLISYATYDLTNLATIKNWPIMITIIDLIWGSLVTATTASVSYYLSKRFLIK
jgi:uncharacterized membrane protein